MSRAVEAGRVPRRSEKFVQADIVQILRSIGAAVYILGTRRPRGEFQGTRQTPGIPDLYVVLPKLERANVTYAPVLLWVEVKASGGRLRLEQARFREECQAAGIAHVVGDLDVVIEFLTHGGWLKAENLPHYRRPA